MLRLKEGDGVREKKVGKLGMIAAGTGITPMYQIIQAVEDDPKDRTALSLICLNQNPSDSILDDDLFRVAD